MEIRKDKRIGVIFRFVLFYEYIILIYTYIQLFSALSFSLCM